MSSQFLVQGSESKQQQQQKQQKSLFIPIFLGINAVCCTSLNSSSNKIASIWNFLECSLYINLFFHSLRAMFSIKGSTIIYFLLVFHPSLVRPSSLVLTVPLTMILLVFLIVTLAILYWTSKPSQSILSHFILNKRNFELLRMHSILRNHSLCPTCEVLLHFYRLQLIWKIFTGFFFWNTSAQSVQNDGEIVPSSCCRRCSSSVVDDDQDGIINAPTVNIMEDVSDDCCLVGNETFLWWRLMTMLYSLLFWYLRFILVTFILEVGTFFFTTLHFLSTDIFLIKPPDCYPLRKERKLFHADQVKQIYNNLTTQIALFFTPATSPFSFYSQHWVGFMLVFQWYIILLLTLGVFKCIWSVSSCPCFQ